MKRVCVIASFVALICSVIVSAITFVSPPSENYFTNQSYVCINITSDENLTNASLEWGNSSGFTNVSMKNSSLTNWYKTMTNLTDGRYNYTVWTYNGTDWNQSERRYVTVDMTPPTIILNSPANNYETLSHKIDFTFRATDNFSSSMSCDLYIDNDKEKSLTAQNNTIGEFENIHLGSGSHTWYVKCSDSTGNSNVSEIRTFKIKPYCEQGHKGDVSVDVIEPNSGDEFYVAENVTIKVKIKNNYNEKLDIVAETELYDLDDDESVADTKATLAVDEGESKTVNLYLFVPYSVNENHDFMIRVKAYEEDNEDSQCDDEAVEVDIKKRPHEVKIERLELEPATVACKGSFSIYLKIGNAGKHDEQIKITVANSDLKIDHTEELSLDEGDVRTIDLPSFFVPQDAQEGNYQITVKVYYDYSAGAWHGTKTGTLTLKVQGNCPGPPQPNASVSFEQVSEAFSGQSFTIKITVRNTGNVKVNYSIEVLGYEEWANFTSLEPSTLELDPGKEGWAILTLEPYENITGNHSLQIKVKFDSKTKEQNITVEVREVTKPSPRLERWKFELDRLWVWLLIIALLTAGVVILTILLYKAQKRAKRAEKRAARVAELRELSLRKK